MRGFTGGTVPAIAVAHRIPVGRMVRIACSAIPVMRAVFARRENLLAAGTDTITRSIGLRSGVLCFVAWTIPVMVAVGVQSICVLADIAIPLFSNDFRRRMPGFVRTPPQVRAVSSRRIHVLLRLLLFACCTIAVLAVAGFRLQMTVLMSRAVPGMHTRRLFRRIIRTPTAFFFAVPITVAASLTKPVPCVALQTIPAAVAMRRIIGYMVRLMVGAVPAVRATRRRGIGSL